MKTRIWIILIISALLIGFVAVEQIFINDTFNYLKNESENLKEIIFSLDNINNNELINKIDNFDETWKQKENILCLIVNHKDLENIGEQIEKIKVLCPQNKKDEAEYEVELLNFYVENYVHIIQTSFQNIF